MNLMFRKNFREQKSGGGVGKPGKTGASRHASKRSSREQGYTPIEEHHYRTHLFFSPTRCAYSIDEDVDEPRCGPMTGASAGDLPPMQSSISPAMSESDLPQPLVVRTPSVSLRWPATDGCGSSKTSPSRQVSFSYGAEGGGKREEGAAKKLSGLDRDCFIIPVHSLERFLPSGVPMPKPPPSGTLAEKKSNASLHVMEVPDPKLCVLCHLMSPLEAIDVLLESPLVQPLLKQRIVAGDLTNEVAQSRTAVTGMLLANMERNADFPFIAYYILNTAQTNPVLFYNNLRTASLTKFDPRALRYTSAHTLDLYTEVASILRPPIFEAGTPFTKTTTPTTGYMVSVYKVFEGDDKEKFERNWLYWTGARMIYRYLPARAGLRKISLHKSVSPKGDKMYLLVCECENLLKDISVCALLLPALRARLTGYTGLYRPIQMF